MGMLERLGLREAHDPEVDRLRGVVDSLEFKLEENANYLGQLQASFAEDRGWSQIGDEGQREMTPEARRQAAELCRVFAISNPLVKRGLALRAGYVWAGGVGIQAPDGKESGTQDVNSVVQNFLDDPGNRKAFTGAQAHVRMENQLGTDGMVYAVLFSNPKTGFTRIRTLDPIEMTDIITNPEDASEVWFYRRDYEESTIGERTAKVTTRQKTTWYPAMGHKPTRRFPVIDGNPVNWDAPVFMVAVNTVGKFGVGDAYAALPWARSYREFLEDWAKLMKSLARIAWKLSGKRSSAQQARSALNGLGEAGGIAAMDPNSQLEAVPKSGATIDAESGRPLATMIAAALGLPVTTLLADPGQTGARAVAETLDQPTRLEMNGRREVWTETYRAILGHVIDQAVLAPQGPLKGGVSVDAYTQQEEVILQGEADRTLTITWPDIDETPVDIMVKAIVDADATQKLPPLETMRLLLRALGVRDVDEILEAWTDDAGNFIDPNTSAGDAAVDAFNRGEDPVAALNK
ncbi:hypothetical protein [Brevibacterium sp. ZH18]|uniref:hypothetical protein n=1 Tax=Brevibacterium sp. ZH18 TaxID=2927784 RepID=UPI001F620F7A|nr:hypothetical protein [Brevibacterium sp. ZH18]MCI4012368.1 hypothetical protein [Brevibacterium sp. ZH18]